ncbi:hypothetical protein ACFLV7_02440 [Chloroflexota bacterium]
MQKTLPYQQALTFLITNETVHFDGWLFTMLGVFRKTFTSLLAPVN